MDSAAEDECLGQPLERRVEEADVWQARLQLRGKVWAGQDPLGTTPRRVVHGAVDRRVHGRVLERVHVDGQREVHERVWQAEPLELALPPPVALLPAKDLVEEINVDAHVGERRASSHEAAGERLLRDGAA